MARDLYLIENNSFRFDHRARREAGSLRNLLGIVDELSPGQVDWTEANCASV